ncbi:M48 family metallopeptidase [Chitinophaga sp.]|uniref:M48 family metallopeptidase n=1 Tax=Chitinophaga sp. TaxID=1869181 RepID=UPI002B6970A3|nr:M48 family metallopeptidase [Chitinophaga sp.]HWV68855.1 M48 family metallopeptidase [Chitinophaga sp.]
MLHAQVKAFSPIPPNGQLLATLEQQFETAYQSTLATLPPKYKKEFRVIYDQRRENIKSKFDKKEIYTATDAREYLDQLLQEIVKTNPLLRNRKIQCFFSRSGVPNASYIGEGIILFNMGLFTQLENESQAAFVLCHELAHYYLQHSENSIARYVNTMNGKDMQQELRKIKASEYGKREQLDKLVQGITFNSRRHSRDHESQADSMGLVFLQNTRFNPNGALTVLALLDTVDTDTMNTSARLQQLFNASAYPFRKKWIAKREGLLGSSLQPEKDQQSIDSLKTHPDCRQRIKLLERTVNAGTQTAWNLINKAAFDSLQQAFKYEVVNYAFENDRYTLSLYYAISLLQEHPDDPFLVTHIGKVLNSCYEAQKAHVLGKHIDLPSPDFSDNYNVLLQMIQNLGLDEFPAISFYYLKTYQPILNTYTAFTRELDRSRQFIQ